MKLNDVKHNHNLTDLLKVLLFAIIMLLPFIDVAVRCGYVMLNKNAHESYTQETQYIETEELKFNVLYYTDTRNYNATENFKINITNAKIYQYDTDPVTAPDDSQYIEVNEGIVNVQIEDKLYNDVFMVLEFQYVNTQKGSVETEINNFKEVKPNTLDNVFEYSVSKLEESNLYNWTTQTGIYTGVSQMTTQLGITTNIIPIIVCYWFFITIIYIILDIVIKLFTLLTHALGSKTA